MIAVLNVSNALFAWLLHRDLIFSIGGPRQSASLQQVSAFKHDCSAACSAAWSAAWSGSQRPCTVPECMSVHDQYLILTW